MELENVLKGSIQRLTLTTRTSLQRLLLHWKPAHSFHIEYETSNIKGGGYIRLDAYL